MVETQEAEFQAQRRQFKLNMVERLGNKID